MLRPNQNIWQYLAGSATTESGALSPSDELFAKYSAFSMRSIIYVLAWLCMWQGAHLSGSPFQLLWLNILAPPLRLHEIFMLFTLGAIIMERILLGDFTLERSYFSAPMIIMGVALFISWLRGSFAKQEVMVVYEAHESIQMTIAFFVMINAFREPEERRILLPLFFFSTLMKALDGIGVKIFSDEPAAKWGVLLFWRDGFLLAFGIIGTLHLMHYNGERWKWLRKFMLFAVPVVVLTLIISYRRTFFVAIIVSAVLMLITVGKGRRKRQAKLLLGLLAGLTVVILATDPIGFTVRLLAVVNPTEEGSAAIRIMEYPNVIRNIYEYPIFGTMVGVPWHEYYPLPLGSNFTTLGAHNTYLYWPLRTGILGTIGFFLLLARAFKAVFINLVLQKTEEDRLINQLSLHSLIIYCTACFFGLMYSDAMTLLMALLLTFFQLQMRHETGLRSYKKVNLFATIKAKQLVFRNAAMVLPDRTGGAIQADAV